MSLEVFPEHRVVIDNLLSLHSGDQLPHAVLVTSVSGVGLVNTVSCLCAALLCERQSDAACESCSSCSRVSAGTHGDYRWLRVAEGKASIGVDQIREASDFVAKTAGYGTQKILVISEADKMTTGASNALLKTLEEPQGNSLLVLTSQRPWLLPATIRSRCQTWRLPALEGSSSTDFLRNAGVAIPTEISGNTRALEQMVLSLSEGKIESRSAVTRMVETVLSRDISVSDAAAEFQRFELIETIESVVLALEARCRNPSGSALSLLTLVQLHRAVASLLQRMRNGSVPAKESTCYKMASLIVSARRNNVADINHSIETLGV